MIPFLAQVSSETPISLWPFMILMVCVVFIVVAITQLRVHAFLALILAAFLAGLMTGDLPDTNNLNKGLFHSRVALDTSEMSGNNWNKAVTWSLMGFGDTAGGIGLVVALAAIIGTCMMGSGAADRVVRALLALCGEKRAGLVLLSSGFLLSIPVFFDTVFFLLIPLARALSLRIGKNYTLYVIAMAGAGAITHSMVPPTPGPLMIADGLKIELGIAMVAGLAASVLPAWVCSSWQGGSMIDSISPCGKHQVLRIRIFRASLIKRTISCQACLFRPFPWLFQSWSFPWFPF